MRLHRPLPGEKEDRPSERGGRGLFQFPREVVEEEFVLQGFDGGVFGDVDEFDLHHAGPVAELLDGDVVAEDGVVCAARRDPALNAGGEVGHGAPCL